MILAIGFRVRSKRGTQFRQWANKNLKEYMIKGFIKKLENFLPLVAIMMQVINQLNYFLHKLKINYCLLSQDKQQQRLL
jgi:acylphosphatase